jgi:serine phosphatase RsbU (regulator of sigma subunit)
LVGLGNNNERRVRLFADGPLLVGRGAHNHLVLSDYRISRQHSRVAHEKDGFVVYDLNSSNGTLVNGVAVRRHPIKAGDELRFGPYAFRVEVAVEPAVEAPTKLVATESITQFFHVSQTGHIAQTGHVPHVGRGLAPDSQGAFRETLEDPSHSSKVGRNATDTIPPPDAAVEEVTDWHDPTQGIPASRESAQFRSEVAPVDLNQLEDAYEKLGTMYAFMQAIGKTIDRRELLDLIASKILEIYGAARSVGIYLRVLPTPAQRQLGHVAAPLYELVHFANAEPTVHVPTLDPATTLAVLHARKGIFSAAAAPTALSGWTMYAPMIDREDALGIICVSARQAQREYFTVGDLDLLNGIAVPAAIMLQNTRMHEESLQRERLNRDLELAAQIQKSFLPREVLSVPGVEFLATYKAAYTVGGDFYDVFWVGPEKLAVFIGDISGKGVAAALLMARITGELRVAALAHVDPVSVFTVMNQVVINRGQPELFFTATYFTLDVKTAEVWLASAGQPSPYLCHADGSVETITEGASGAIGMLDDPQLTATRFFLRDGDSIVMYTDGVVEAAALDGSLYGDDRLAACLRTAGSSPANISEQILASVAKHTVGAPANDDLTIFVCHRSLGGAASLQPRRYGSIQQPPPQPLPRTTQKLLTGLQSGRRGE